MGLWSHPHVQKFFNGCKWCAVVVFFFCVAALTLSFFTGCSLLGFRKLPDLNEKDVYKHDLVLDINGKRINGVGAISIANEYKVRVYPPGNVDRIMWRTCSMENVIDKPDVKTSSWFGGYSYVDFTYKPAFGLDDVNSCALKIEVLEEKKRRNGMALVEFESSRPEASLFSDLLCNGQFSQNKGVSICQSAAGLYQQISFPTPVVIRAVEPACDVMKPFEGDEKVYQFSIAPSECTYVFVAQGRAPNGKRFEHVLTTVGYTDVPPIK